MLNATCLGWLNFSVHIHVCAEENCVYLRVQFYTHFQIFRHMPESSAAASRDYSNNLNRFPENGTFSSCLWPLTKHWGLDSF